MAPAENLVIVFVAGVLTALATGLGAGPFFFGEEFSDRWNVGLWGIASGIMVTVSTFGDIRPATSMVEVTRLIEPEMLVNIEADVLLIGQGKDSI